MHIQQSSNMYANILRQNIFCSILTWLMKKINPYQSTYSHILTYQIRTHTHTHTDYRSKMAVFLWRFCGFVRPSVGSLSLALGEAESPGWLFNELFSFSTLTCWFVFKVFCNFHLLSETQQVLQQKPSSHIVGFLRGFLVYVCIVGKEWVSVW